MAHCNGGQAVEWVEWADEWLTWLHIWHYIASSFFVYIFFFCFYFLKKYICFIWSLDLFKYLITSVFAFDENCFSVFFFFR